MPVSSGSSVPGVGISPPSGMRTASVIAQAKVNLLLKVLAREADGYHQLETLFCRLALGDVVTVHAVPHGRSLDCVGPAMPPGGLGKVEDNLAWRAAAAFVDAAGWPDGFAIEITKHIPVGGGLGGGSADAGAVLRALNAMAPTPLSPARLLRVGAQLGADIPFLTQDQSPLALAWGRGERLLSLPPLDARACVLLAFPFGVATQDAYGWLTTSPATASLPVTYSITDFAEWRRVESIAYNEFERVVLPQCPPIQATLATLRTPKGTEAFDLSLMSGSGSTVFALPGHGSGDGWRRTLASLSALGAMQPRVVETFTAAHVEPVRLAD